MATPTDIIEAFGNLKDRYDKLLLRHSNPPALRRIYQHAQSRGGQLSAPLVVMLDLTSMCNANCSFCYRSGPATLMPRGEAGYLNLERLDELCAEFQALNVASLTLSGGEPTCHPQFLEAVRMVKERDFSVTVVTNGTGLERDDIRRLAALLDPNRDQVELSFNAARRETFRAVVRSGRFETFLDTLRAFREYRMPFVTMSLILAANADEIEQIVDLGGRFGARECAVEAPFPKNHMQAELYVDLERVLEIYARLLERDQAVPFITLNFFHLLEHLRRLYPAATRAFPEPRGCHAGEASCAIDIDGNVHLCQFVIDNQSTRLGRVADRPLSAIWREARARKREAFVGGDREGGCPAFDWEASRGQSSPGAIDIRLSS